MSDTEVPSERVHHILSGGTPDTLHEMMVPVSFRKLTWIGGSIKKRGPWFESVNDEGSDPDDDIKTCDSKVKLASVSNQVHDMYDDDDDGKAMKNK